MVFFPLHMQMDITATVKLSLTDVKCKNIMNTHTHWINVIYDNYEVSKKKTRIDTESDNLYLNLNSKKILNTGVFTRTSLSRGS